jgi:hypothetical protein
MNFIMGWVGGASTLARYPLAGGEPEPIPVRIPRDALPVRVTADGRSLLLFVAAKGQVDRLELATGRVTPWKVLRPDDLTGVTFVNPPILALGDDAYAYNYCRLLMNLYLIEGLR